MASITKIKPVSVLYVFSEQEPKDRLFIKIVRVKDILIINVGSDAVFANDKWQKTVYADYDEHIVEAFLEMDFHTLKEAVEKLIDKESFSI